MYQIRLESGEFLDGNFDFQFELNNQVFTTASTDILPGSFSFSVNCPLTDRTRRLLNNPQNVNNSTQWKEYQNTWVLAYGVPIFVGTMRIQEAGGNNLKLQLLSDPINEIKDLKLPEIDFEGTRSTGPMVWPNYMKLVAQNPDDYDFTFFQVEYGKINQWPAQSFQNQYEPVSDAFNTINHYVTPFISMYYVLKRGFDMIQSGWSFANIFQDADIELRRIYLYNNADVRVLSGGSIVFPIQWDIKKHVPPITFRDFLKKICATFGLGIFTNHFTKKISLIAIKTIFERETKQDWTGYIISALKITDKSAEESAYYNYPQIVEDSADFPPLEQLKTFNNVAEYNAHVGDGFFFIESINTVAYRKSTAPAVFYTLGPLHKGVRVKLSGADYQAGVVALPNAFSLLGVGGYVSPDTEISTWVQSSGGEWKYDIKPYPFAICLYRGMQQRDPGNPKITPLAANSVWRDEVIAPAVRSKITHAGTDIKTSEYSLNWHGEYGLYNKFHYLWAESLRNGKHITQQFALPITALTAFTFDQKVRVQEMDYIIKKLRVGKCIGDNKVQVQAEMVSVI